jgi:hypothetical protein
LDYGSGELGFGDGIFDEIMKKAYPKLHARWEELEEDSQEYRSEIRKAVEGERQRLSPGGQRGGSRPEGKTQLAKDLQKKADAPAVVADRWANEIYRRELKKFDDKKTKH